MQKQYHNVVPDIFYQDLLAKDWVILLFDEKNALAGFSTLQLFNFSFKDETLRIAFSGDTIVDPEHWGSLQLPLAFGQLMNQLEAADPERPLYWLLISKGFRTYRFLPVFFKVFYPSCLWSTPANMLELMNELGSYKFPENYKDGIIHADNGAQVLDAALAGNEQHQLRKDKNIDFFFRSNPGHRTGNELLCLAHYCQENLRPYIARQLKKELISDVC